jgi:hypothetical protein
MSVDPPGCKDIDDALHVRKLANGNWEFGVHIADVTSFVECVEHLILNPFPAFNAPFRAGTAARLTWRRARAARRFIWCSGA